MVEKKFCVSDLRINYNGPIDIIDFFKTVEDWIVKKGMHKEIKKKSEHVTEKNKRVEWFIEIWETPADYAKRVVRLQTLFKDIKDVKVNLKGKERSIQSADVLVLLDGILETDLEARWFQKPTYYFWRAIYDKYISKFYTHRFEGKITSDTYELYHHLMNYFNSYR
ncbi:MAG: hypothetical protein ABIJ08_06050 [Nanoarchaeota archaeon]